MVAFAVAMTSFLTLTRRSLSLYINRLEEVVLITLSNIEGLHKMITTMGVYVSLKTLYNSLLQKNIIPWWL